MTATFEPIATTQLTATATTVTFSSIPATYTDLRLIAYADSYYTSTSWDGITVRFNSDSGNNYRIIGWDATNSGRTGVNRTQGYAEGVVGMHSTAGQKFSTIVMDFYDYAGSNIKTMMSNTRYIDSTTVWDTNYTHNSWSNTAAITSITLGIFTGSSYWWNGSQFTLFGIKQE